MEVKCPYCDEISGLNGIHRHLIDAHLDLVIVEPDEESGKMFVTVECPFCELSYRKAVKAGFRDPAFLEEYRRDIALVAFDQQLYHIAKDHAAEAGIDLPAEESEE